MWLYWFHHDWGPRLKDKSKLGNLGTGNSACHNPPRNWPNKATGVYRYCSSINRKWVLSPRRRKHHGSNQSSLLFFTVWFVHFACASFFFSRSSADWGSCVRNPQLEQRGYLNISLPEEKSKSPLPRQQALSFPSDGAFLRRCKRDSPDTQKQQCLFFDMPPREIRDKIYYEILGGETLGIRECCWSRIRATWMVENRLALLVTCRKM